jgi:hypothetical protein
MEKSRFLTLFLTFASFFAISLSSQADEHENERTQFLTYFSTYTTDHLGQIFLTGVVKAEDYRKVDFEIIQWPPAAVSMNVQCNMGKISGETLAASVVQFPLGTAAQIHSFDVVGPELSCVLTGGPPNTAVPLQAWLFLH